MGPKTVIPCLALLAVFPRTYASNCGLIIRMTDLQDTIKVQRNVAENQTRVIEDQERTIEKQADTIDDLRQTIKHLKSGVYFMVGLNHDVNFELDGIMKFDKIITNVGGGYIDDNNSIDYGKFIAPQNGTYLFNANIYNGNELVGADLAKNGALVIAARSMYGGGSASLSAILDLKEGDEVYLGKPGWVGHATRFSRFFTSFSGVLVYAAV